MISSLDAVRAISRERGDAVVVSTMTPNRYWESVSKNRDLDLPIFGAMGKASSVALGIALAQPDKKIVVLDGDGGCPLGRLGVGPGTGLVRGDRLVVRPAPPAGGLVGEVRRTSIRGGRTLLDLDVAGVAIRAWWDGPAIVGDRVELVLADGAVVPLAG